MLDFFNAIGDFLSSVVSGLLLFLDMLASIPDTVSQLMTIIPTPITVLVLGLVTLVIILKIVGR